MDAGEVTAEQDPFGWKFTAPLLLGSTLNPINTSMIATALVGIGDDMHAGPSGTASLISVLYLCSAVCQPTMGKLSTLFGSRRIFLLGVAIFGIGGVLGAIAPTFGCLLLSRALIGIGSAACYPTAMALIRKRADAAGTGVPSRVLGNLSIAGQVTAVVGLPLGGILAGLFGWRAIFAVNVPLALMSIALTLTGVAEDEKMHGKSGESVLTALDIPGIACFAGAITSMLAFLTNMKKPEWPLLALTTAFAAALVAWEHRARNPLVDVRMLAKNLPLQRTYLRQIITYLVTYSVLYGVSQWMEQSRHLTASAVGIVLVPLSLISIVAARVVSSRGLVRRPLIIGGFVQIATAVVMLSITHESHVAILVGMSVLLGLSNGLSGFANQAALYMQTAAEDIAVASGLLRTATYLGAIFSSSLIGLAFGSGANDAGFHLLAWTLGAIGIAVTALTMLDAKIPMFAE